MTSSSEPQNVQNVHTIADPAEPEYIFAISEVQSKSKNFCGLFDLPEGKEYLHEAKEFLLNYPLNFAFTTNPTSKK